MARVVVWTCVLVFFAQFFSCTCREKGTCEKDSHCEGAQVCFEGKCITMKEREEILEKREEEAKPKICRDEDGDGVRAGDGCPEGELIDCNDDDPNIAPGKTEVCDAVDNNCDGRINEGSKGCVQTLFGGATWGNQKEHRLVNPTSVLYHKDGYVLVTDNHHLWKVHLDGAVELLAGSHLSHFQNGSGAEVRFSYPQGLAWAPDGNVYVSDMKNNCIRKVTLTGTATSIAGFCSTLTKYTNQFADGQGESARFYGVADTAVAADGTLFVIDRINSRIRKVTTDGTVTTIAGVGPVEVEEGTGQIGFLDGPAHEARFNDPQSILVDSKGFVYVSESFNCRIRLINPKKGETGEVTTLCGESDTNLGIGGFQDGAGKQAKFSFPHGMIWDQKGNIIIADTGNAVIRRVTRSGAVRTMYGKAGEDKCIDGPIDQARFQTPMDLALGPDGSLFVVDTACGRLRWIVP